MKERQEETNKQIYTHKPKLNQKSKQIVIESQKVDVFNRLGIGPSADMIAKREKRV